MTSIEPNESFSFSLAKINLVEKSLNSPVKTDDFIFDISLNIGQHPESMECVHHMQVNISGKVSGKKVGSIGIICVFNIPKYNEYASGSNGSLSQQQLYILNTVVFGTMRGLMFAEFRGTFLENAYLPVLDPREFKDSQKLRSS
jgi:hypothetical protein